MIKFLFKIILLCIFITIAAIAMVEVYPEKMKEIEAKAGTEIVTSIQSFTTELKTKIDTTRDKDYQRNIEDIVNNEIVE